MKTTYKKSDAADPSEVADGWAKGTFHPVYLFAGSDPVLKEEALTALRRHFLGAEEDLNLDRFDGATAAAGAILSAANTMSLLGGRRMVVVRRADELSKDDWEILTEGIASFGGANCLVLLWDQKADEKSAVVRAVRAAKGEVLTFWVPFENRLAGWVQQRAATLGKSMPVDVAQALVDLVGPNTADLHQEVEKLALFVKDAKAVRLEDVEAIRPTQRTLGYMELDRAFWRRDRAEALTLLRMFREQGEAPEKLLPMMVGVFRRLLKIKAVSSEEKLDPFDLGRRFKINSPPLVREMTEALGNWSWDDLLGVMERLLRADWDMKTGRMDPETGMTLLVVKLTERGRRA